ncbi:MAG TPA: hypothetical protein DCM08_04940, partial [Microscillaceae bacterium]|nr:hypothetical protein [Microscillaceae bacterium]
MSKKSIWKTILRPWIEVHDGRSRLDPWLWANLKQALRQQQLDKLMQRLVAIVPDISNQYTNPEGMNCMDPQSPDYVPFYAYKVRAQHAFQVQFTLAVMQQWFQQHPPSPKGLTLVDVGDSSGNHLRYLEHLLHEAHIHVGRSLSINLDPKAIEKITQSGREALLCRAEHLSEHNIEADFMLTYEMLEHLLNPVEFLHQIAQHPPKGLLIATVPFLRQSRLGMHHIRLNITEYPADPEDVHI